MLKVRRAFLNERHESCQLLVSNGQQWSFNKHSSSRLLNIKAAELSPCTVFPLQILSLCKHIGLLRSVSPFCVFLKGARVKGQCSGCQGPLLQGDVQISVHHRPMNHLPLGEETALSRMFFPFFPKPWVLKLFHHFETHQRLCNEI